MKNRVLIINVPYFVPTVVPYGPAVVSGILNANGYEASSWDLNIDLYNEFNQRTEWELFHRTLVVGWASYQTNVKSFLQEVIEWTANALREKIAEFKPDMVGISVFSSQNADFVIPLVTMIKEQLPDSYVFIGGRGLDNPDKLTNEIAGEFLLNRLPIDCAYIGDAENQLVTCLNDRVRGVFVADPVTAAELESVPRANWSGYDFSKYPGYDSNDLMMPITASKGCVRQCTFCDVENSWPKFIFRKGADVAEELISIYHETGMHRIEFTDNLINGSVSNFREMNTVLATKLPNTLRYKGYAICRDKKSSPREDFELAKVAGADIFKIGIESGSESVRYDMKKKFSNSDIDWFAMNCVDVGIKQIWLMFVGYPTETESDFQETLALLDRYKANIQSGDIRIWLSLPMMMSAGGNIMKKYSTMYGLDHSEAHSNPWWEHFWKSDIYTSNTFDVRADRWKRFIHKLEAIDVNFLSGSQGEKLMEVEGLEKLYADYQKKSKEKIINIVRVD